MVWKQRIITFSSMKKVDTTYLGKLFLVWLLQSVTPYVTGNCEL